MAHPTSSDDAAAFDTTHIAGNASDDIKQLLGNPGAFLTNRPTSHHGPIFAEDIQRRLKVTEISIQRKAEEERKMEARYVVEVEVVQDMLNGGGNIHGGCSAFLVDVCSSLCLIALGMATTGDSQPSVSQSLNIVYHSPAQAGDKLRIVNTTLTLGARAHSVRTEIWNVTHRRLVVSGTHVKMQPSMPKPNL
ncbi:HotDog domain-containing protein [Pholiota molesta]|nr:HotDog domain-containing protein [Pholiota molesta]